MVRKIQDRTHQYIISIQLLRKVTHQSNSKETKHIKWQSHEAQWVTLNTDGVVYQNHIAGCGRIIRDFRGKWVGGFSRRMGNAVL